MSDATDYSIMLRMMKSRKGSQGAVSTYNHVRSQLEVSLFHSNPLPLGAVKYGYLSESRNVITTWMGDTLASVTRRKQWKSSRGGYSSERGSFWAIGVDGRTYYGRDNGPGMSCTLRLSKNQP